MSVAHPPISSLRLLGSALVLVAAAWHGVGWVGAAPLAGIDQEIAATIPVGHLVVSEVQTGGVSASDEFIELYNPSPTTALLDGIELIYVTSTGATITRKAAFVAGTQIEPGCHLLIANSAGIFAGIADLTYANGLAATGGSIAIRVISASSAIDAVGWGTAASVWMEGSAAPAPPAGQSLERLPGGAAGSGQDLDINLIDFVVNAVPGPENAQSSPVPAATESPSPSPSATETPSATEAPSATPTESPTETPSASASPIETPSPSDSPSPTPTLSPTPTPTPSPTVVPISVASARAQPDGTQLTVVGVALTDGDFHDGGGFVTDESGGIAVLVGDGTFDRGQLLRIRGTVDDRYAQRTIRTTVADIEVLGTDADPVPASASTGSIGETTEGELVLINGLIDGAPTVLTSGLAFEVDDGSGAVRVLVGPDTGIDTSGWLPGAEVTTIGIAGQRDSSGTGTAGYRVMPRDPADVLLVAAPPSPSPSPSPTPTSTASSVPTPSPTPGPTATPQPYISIAAARTAESGTAVRVRGVVTLPSGLVDEVTAAIADPSGAIVVRLGDAAGTLTLGQWVEITGVRSTKSGMTTIRVSVAPLVLGQQPDPTPLRRPTGGISEAHEAVLVVIRGAVTAGPQRSSAGSVSLTLDDGSGPAKVLVYPGAGASTSGIHKGAWVEVVGVVGQQTTKAEPTSGYRIWPRIAADVRLVASATSPAPTGSGGSNTARGGSSAASPTGQGTSGTPAPGIGSTPGSVSLAAPEADASAEPTEAGEQSPTAPLPAPTIPLLGSSLAAMGLLGLLMTRHGTPQRVMEVGRRRLAELRELED